MGAYTEKCEKYKKKEFLILSVSYVINVSSKFGTEIRKNIEDKVYIFDIFANFSPKFWGNIRDISNAENKKKIVWSFSQISVYAPTLNV